MKFIRLGAILSALALVVSMIAVTCGPSSAAPLNTQIAQLTIPGGLVALAERVNVEAAIQPLAAPVDVSVATETALHEQRITAPANRANRRSFKNARYGDPVSVQGHSVRTLNPRSTLTTDG